jgi:regulator of sigma E protease
MVLTIIAFIVVLGITITIHEFGHFAAAKLLKIRVLVFSIGFGPRLLGFTRGGTEYRISPIPIGGYVKMAGETFDQERQGAPDEFLSHPKWHRFLVAVAGPFMNILLAVAVLTFTYLGGAFVPKYRKEAPVVGPVVANSIAARAGMRSGDLILSIRGTRVRTWEETEIAVGTVPRQPLDFVVERAGRRINLQLEHPGVANVDPTDLGFKYSLPRTRIQQVVAGSPAEAAGMKAGDEILSVRGAGKSGRTYDEILNIITESKGIPLTFEVLRKDETTSAAGEILELKATPTEENGRVMLGFAPWIPVDVEKYNLAGAVRQSIRQNFEMAVMTFRIIGRIFTGAASVRSISGPIEIARYSGEAARTGSLRLFFGFLGLVSLNLGVFNLLPIPILDGGVIALLLVEALIRRDLSLAIKEKVVQVGFVFLILLMGFVVVNDLSKLPIFEKFFR